eukprot:365362-Chlamydomonas_euryale.AAC.28
MYIPLLHEALGTPFGGWAPPTVRRWGAAGGRLRRVPMRGGTAAQPSRPHTARCGRPPSYCLVR